MDKLALVLGLAVVGLGVSARLHAWIAARAGSESAIMDPVRAGMRGFVGRQLRGSLVWSACLAALLFVGHRFASPSPYDGSSASPAALGGSAVAMLGLGAALALAVMRLASMLVVPVERATTAATTRSREEGLVTALRGGACVALLVSALAVIGVAGAFAALHFADRAAPVTRIPLRLAPYALGAAIVALVTRTTGAIFGRAAADGEIELRHVDPTVPETDLRNPALVTSLVARRVGDRLGRAAEVFAQLAIEGVATMILAGGFAEANRPTLARAGVDPWAVVLFPLVVRALSLVAAIAGVMAVKTDGDEEPMDALDRGYWVSAALGALALFAAAYWTFRASAVWFAVAGLLGVLGGHAFVLLARYHADPRYRPSKDVATGPADGASVLVRAMSIGLGATAVPVIVLGLVLFGAYRCGEASTLSHGGIVATAVAAIGMLSAGTYLFAIEHLGPFSDSEGEERLAAVAIAARNLVRGHSIGAVAVVALVALRAYLYVVLVQRAASTGEHAPLDLDLGRGVMLACALGGGALAIAFVSLCLKGVGHVSAAVVAEAKAELADLPREDGRVVFPIDHRPDYRTCVDTVASDAHLHAFAALLLAVSAPIAAGFFLRRGGGVGAEGVGVLVVVSVVVSFLLSLSLAAAGSVTRATGADDAAGALRDVAAPVLTTFMLAVTTILVTLAPLFA
jgi:K(+)-stimulated pyrophosphate-energized sodium pump